MRKSSAIVLVILFSCIGGFGRDARAGVTIDVYFTPPLSRNATASYWGPYPEGTGCAFGGKAGGSATTGICMDVILTSTLPLIALSTSIAYSTNHGLAIGAMYEWAGVAWGPRFCAPSGGLYDSGSRIESFDCAISSPANPPQLDPGTYKIGTIVWDISAFGPGDAGGQETIAPVINDLFDGVRAIVNGNEIKLTSADIVVNGGSIYILPEPGTAALLGLGLAGFTLAARRCRG